MNRLSAILIREPWVDLILEGCKTCETRSEFTKKIGPVALIRSDSVIVVATAPIYKIALKNAQ